MPRFLLANNRTYLAAALAICTFLYLSIFSFRHINRLSSERQVETYDFQDTADERQCFSSGGSSTNPIPNVVHVIWLNTPDLTFMNYLALRSALISLQPEQVKFHYTEPINEGNVWLQKLRGNLAFVRHDLETEYPEQIRQGWQVTHLADALRLDVIRNEGGIYLDMDVISLRSFSGLLHSDRNVLLGSEGGDRHGLCNAIIIGRQHAPFVTRWVDTYRDFSVSEWNNHSVILPKRLAHEHPDEICPLSPTVFFWPTWTENHIRYMHEPISEGEVSALERTMDQNGGSLYPNQLAYHAWSQVAWKPYLQHLTPELVRERNTRFNVMVRRFLE
jgi:hypothetical protein